MGLAISLAGGPEITRVVVYLAAIVVGGLPIFRAAVAGLRARHLDMNVLMSAATVGAVGIGEWAEAASVVVLFAAGNALQVYAIDRTRGAEGARAPGPERGTRQEGRSEVVVPRRRSTSAIRWSSGPARGWRWTAGSSRAPRRWTRHR